MIPSTEQIPGTYEDFLPQFLPVESLELALKLTSTFSLKKQPNQETKTFQLDEIPVILAYVNLLTSCHKDCSFLLQLPKMWQKITNEYQKQFGRSKSLPVSNQEVWVHENQLLQAIYCYFATTPRPEKGFDWFLSFPESCQQWFEKVYVQLEESQSTTTTKKNIRKPYIRPVTRFQRAVRQKWLVNLLPHVRQAINVTIELSAEEYEDLARFFFRYLKSTMKTGHLPYLAVAILTSYADQQTTAIYELKTKVLQVTQQKYLRKYQSVLKQTIQAFTNREQEQNQKQNLNQGQERQTNQIFMIKNSESTINNQHHTGPERQSNPPTEDTSQMNMKGLLKTWLDQKHSTKIKYWTTSLPITASNPQSKLYQHVDQAIRKRNSFFLISLGTTTKIRAVFSSLDKQFARPVHQLTFITVLCPNLECARHLKQQLQQYSNINKMIFIWNNPATPSNPIDLSSRIVIIPIHTIQLALQQGIVFHHLFLHSSLIVIDELHVFSPQQIVLFQYILKDFTPLQLSILSATSGNVADVMDWLKAMSNVSVKPVVITETSPSQPIPCHVVQAGFTMQKRIEFVSSFLLKKDGITLIYGWDDKKLDQFFSEVVSHAHQYISPFTYFPDTGEDSIILKQRHVHQYNPNRQQQFSKILTRKLEKYNLNWDDLDEAKQVELEQLVENELNRWETRFSTGPSFLCFTSAPLPVRLHAKNIVRIIFLGFPPSGAKFLERLEFLQHVPWLSSESKPSTRKPEILLIPLSRIDRILGSSEFIFQHHLYKQNSLVKIQIIPDVIHLYPHYRGISHGQTPITIPYLNRLGQLRNDPEKQDMFWSQTDILLHFPPGSLHYAHKTLQEVIDFKRSNNGFMYPVFQQISRQDNRTDLFIYKRLHTVIEYQIKLPRNMHTSTDITTLTIHPQTVHLVYYSEQKQKLVLVVFESLPITHEIFTTNKIHLRTSFLKFICQYAKINIEIALHCFSYAILISQQLSLDNFPIKHAVQRYVTASRYSSSIPQEYFESILYETPLTGLLLNLPINLTIELAKKMYEDYVLGSKPLSKAIKKKNSISDILPLPFCHYTRTEFEQISDAEIRGSFQILETTFQQKQQGHSISNLL